MLRADIQQAGFGLPWNMGGNAYNEAVNDPTTVWDDTAYNDNGNPPRALVVGAATGLNGSDILVVKATSVATNATAHKSTYITPGAVPPIRVTGSAQDDLINTDYVIAIQQVDRTNGNLMVLLSTALNEANGAFQFVGTPPGNAVTGITPTTGFIPPESNLIFGVSPNGSPPRMPFNRADYYIRTPAAANMPTRCAPGTGVLYKGTVNHADGGHLEMPLLDCVADMRVVVAAEVSPPGTTIRTGTPNTFWFSGAGQPGDAQNMRNEAIDVRVYIVAQDGQFDPSFSYKNQVRPPAPGVPAACDFDNVVCIMDMENGASVFFRAIDLSALPGIGTRWQNYRWKLYTLVVKPYFSLR
jgi:hypothetical protein